MSDAASEITAEELSASTSVASPTEVVERFLDLLCAQDVDNAAELLGADVDYTNVGLPTLRGRERIRRLFRRTLGRRRAGFEVYMHTIAANRSTVLTERTDVLRFGSLRIQFWVCGRFEVRDGQIVVWRDYFDRLNYAAATIRGMVGIIIPPARAKPPTHAELAD